MRQRVLLGCALVCLSAAGCSNAHEGDVDSGVDSGFVIQDSWVIDTARDWCGSVQCGVGTTCCNASCGICTAPGVGCVALACTDGGVPTHACGGLTPSPCAPSEYCDYPDASFCGGDDERGVCRPRPTDCPDPGGNRVCGCDGTDYIGDCSAYLAGTDIAHQGPCEMPPPPASQASATRSCGPTDGPAWDFVITTGAPLCGAASTGWTMTIDVARNIDDSSGETTIVIGGGTSSQGSATVCPAGVGGPPCFSLSGSVVFSGFHANVGAVMAYQFQTSDGTAYTGSNVSVSLWCPGTPICG